MAMRVRRGHADPSHKKCPAARQTESATHSTSCTDMVPVPSLTGARITLIVRRIGLTAVEAAVSALSGLTVTAVE